MRWLLLLSLAFLSPERKAPAENSWIRINLMGYPPAGLKVAVWCSKDTAAAHSFRLVDEGSGKTVFSGRAGQPMGAYGPFSQTARLDFSAFRRPGRYRLEAGGARSPAFTIATDVYRGAADFCLRYMRQQRSGFNPFLKDSCHTRDGYTLYGAAAGLPDSSFVDVTGGWHDASDYLQYATTSANAVNHLLMAYRDYPQVFGDEKKANGLEGGNGLPDVLDEAKWGLDWLLKMHPRSDWMFNQIADDRDHISMRIPAQDTQYGRGNQRPVYFITGEPQQRGKFLNATTGTSSTAAKFATAFALAQQLYQTDSLFRKADTRRGYYDKAMSALQYALKKPGVTQTASVRAPYIYEEDNWVDDLELAYAAVHDMVVHTPGSGDNGYYFVNAVHYAKREPVTPWLGEDTARHYQWYPFINLGHYEILRQIKAGDSGPGSSYDKDFVRNFPRNADTIRGFYRTGIERVWNKARTNAFYRGVPFIWCSNNLTVSFALQCLWYRQMTGDRSFEPLEQANFDWIFGCNPWGTSMVYGLPAGADTPEDPHSAFTHLKGYPIDGGLVDGPVYGSIFNNLRGIQLYSDDEYAPFQSSLAVYHDDYGDYSTNEPTMDGTASLVYLLAAREAAAEPFPRKGLKDRGAYVRGDSLQRRMALVFTGHEFGEGGTPIADALKKAGVHASFFLTGDFYRNPRFTALIRRLKNEGHYLGPHSDKHLLYCDWNKRDSLLVSRSGFAADLLKNTAEMDRFGIRPERRFFLPPYEWYNDSVAAWSKSLGWQLVNFTPGTRSNADYTTLADANYRSSEAIHSSILQYEAAHASGLNGFILLLHIGAGPGRTDKFYERLPQLLDWLKKKGYQPVRIDELL